MSAPNAEERHSDSPAAEQGAERDSPVSWFAGHHVAANLLMAFVFVLGLLSLSSIVIEVIPEFTIDSVTISVAYPGASPAETEAGVALHIEEAIAAIDGIDKIVATAAEGACAVVAEIDEGADQRRVLDDIKAAVDRIDTFPEDAEQPVISEVVSRRQVVNLVIFGNASPATLAHLAERARDDLTATDTISQAELSGVPPYEISIEVSEHAMRRWGLTFTQVAEAVRATSLDLPGGAIKTAGGEILLRTQGQMYHGPELEEIVVRTRGDGTEILLRDVATVIDGFADADISTRFDGHPAALVQVYRTGDEGALEVAATVKDYAEQIRAGLPAGVEVSTSQDSSTVLRQRIGLLLENARIGLFLVFVCLALFLDLRLAFWTTMGIPISFFGGLWLLPHLGVTINMISLFAFIVSLGIVVDDAIVVGENIYSHLQRGDAPMQAAIAGVREMTTPVTFAILTSIAAFLPMVFVEGVIGTVMRNIPLVVIAVLAMSLIECLLILPAHLAGDGKGPRFLRPIVAPILRLHNALRARVTAGLERVIRGPYQSTLEWTLEWRYLTVSIALAILLLAGGVVAAGYLKFTFMPTIDADGISAFLEMPQGTPVEQTETVARYLESALQDVGAEHDAEAGRSASILTHISTTVGEQPTAGGNGPISLGGGSSGGHVAEITAELVGGDARQIGSSELMRRWRERVGEVPGASSLTYKASVFSAGDAISVELAHEDFDSLLAASDQLKEDISEYPGVKDVADSFVPGKRELQFDLTSEGRALGLDLRTLARQVRQGFFGEEAQRIQRGRDEIKIMVRYPEEERTSQGDIDAMRIRLSDGTEVPLLTVATLSEGRGYATIRRVDRRRVVTVTADVDETVANANQINSNLQATVLPRLVADFPGLSYDFEGEERERAESIGSLRRNFAVALLAIFALLAVPFRSYTQPLIIMSVIPFGIVGAVAGHLLMGINLSLLSFFGMVALTGVVVNDSLILIDLINRERQRGVPVKVAIREAGSKRFRPIVLTTLTTFFGLAPMILETSLQAQFLIPMAISLGFGVVFATAITLVLVPVVYQILEDVHGLFVSSELDGAKRPHEEIGGVVEAGAA